MESEIYKSVREKFGDRLIKDSDPVCSVRFDRRTTQLEELIRKVNPKRVLEIGTHLGLSAAFFAEFVDIVITLDMRGKSICYEVWKHLGVMNKIKYYVIPGNGAKKNVVKFLNFDCAYIDGNHAYKEVLLDYEITKKCGSVIFHDYAWHLTEEGKEDVFHGVTSFVNSLPEDEVTKSPPFALWRDKNGE